MVERVVDYRVSAIDVLDRVLDKGIVIDGWWRLSLVGIDLMTVNCRILVASIDTYLRHAPVLAGTSNYHWLELSTSSRASSPASKRDRAAK